jgi:hypothetical protein
MGVCLLLRLVTNVPVGGNQKVNVKCRYSSLCPVGYRLLQQPLHVQSRTESHPVTARQRSRVRV